MDIRVNGNLVTKERVGPGPLHLTTAAVERPSSDIPPISLSYGRMCDVAVRGIVLFSLPTRPETRIAGWF